MDRNGEVMEVAVVKVGIIQSFVLDHNCTRWQKDSILAVSAKRVYELLINSDYPIFGD